MSLPARRSPKNSIASKITRLVLLAVFTSVFIAAGFFVWRQTEENIAARKDELTATARVFAAVVAPHVTANDKAQALNAIRAIAQMPSVPYIQIANAENKHFAALGSAVLLSREKQDGKAQQKAMPSTLSLLANPSLSVQVPDISSGATVGPHYLLADSSAGRNQVIQGLIGIIVSAYAACLFGEVVANIAEGRMSRYLRVNITLQVDGDAEETVTADVETRGAILRNWLLGYLSNLQIEDIRGQTGQNRIRREVQNHFNEILSPDGTDVIHDVLFEEFQVQ